MTTPAASYARISRTDKNVPKVANQHRANRKLAQASGYEIVAEYTDDGISATTGEARPDFLRLMVDAADAAFQVVVAANVDRLFRSAVDTQLLSVACEPHGVTWHTGAQGVIDPASPDGEFNAFLQAGLARREVRVKNKRQREANLARREGGQMFASGAVPFGFNADRATLNEAEAALIKAGIETINTGGTLLEVVGMFRASGIKPRRSATWQYISVRDMILPWRNAGVVSFKGAPTDTIGQWAPIVTRAELETCRSILLTSSGQRRTPSHLLSGVAVCDCGEWMTGSNRNGKPHYSCSARQRGLHLDRDHVAIRTDTLDGAVIDHVVDAYRFGVGEDAPPEAEDHRAGAQIAAARAALAGLDADQAGLLRLRGSFPESQLMAEAARLNAQRTELTQRLNELVREDAAATMRDVALGALYVDATGQRRGSLGSPTAEDLRARFVALPTGRQRNLIKILFTVEVGPGRGSERIRIDRRRGGIINAGLTKRDYRKTTAA